MIYNVRRFALTQHIFKTVMYIQTKNSYEYKPGECKMCVAIFIQ